MDDDRMATVARLWQAHCGAPFPDRLKSADVVGIEMVTLDADVSGCVSAWLKGGGSIDPRRWGILASRERELQRVVPALSGHEAAYCRRLLSLTELVLAS